VSYVARVSGTVSEKINTLRALTPSQLAEALPVTAESVVVSIEGASVAIAVRDATLSDEHALRTGFEAARKLSGRSAALRQLTLNGRTIYQQHVDASSQGAERLDAPLLFGC
jgi:hypothetical protein